MPPRLTIIRRHIGAFLDYSIKSNLFREKDTSPVTSFNYDKGVPCRCLDAQIISQTTYFGTSFETRQLASKELKNMFGLPYSCLLTDTFDHTDFAFQPIQIIEALLYPILNVTNGDLNGLMKR